MGQKTYIALVLDRSGSMKWCREATLKGLNKQITVIRKDAEKPGIETFVSYYTFNEKLQPQYKCRPVNYLEDVVDYEIGGDTAVYDAVGTVIDDLKADTDYNNPDNSYLIFVVTDGKERCSKIFTKDALSAKVDACQATGRWTITYLGANQNIQAVAEGLKMHHGNLASYSSNARGTDYAWTECSTKLDSYLKLRRTGVKAVKSFHNAEGSVADYKVDQLNQELPKVLGRSNIKAK